MIERSIALNQRIVFYKHIRQYPLSLQGAEHTDRWMPFTYMITRLDVISQVWSLQTTFLTLSPNSHQHGLY